jgi:hypothetical protein
MTPEEAKAARDKNTTELFLMLVRNTGVKGIPGASLAPHFPTHYTSPNPTTPSTVTSPEALPAEIMSMIIDIIRDKNDYDLATFSQTSRFYKSVVSPMIYDTIEITADFEQRVARCMPDYSLKSPFKQTKTIVLRHLPNPKYCESLGNEHYLTHRLFPNVKKIIWTPKAIESFTEEMGLIDYKRWGAPDMIHLPKIWVFELANAQKVDVQVLCPTREQIDRMRFEYERIPHRPLCGAHDLLDEELRRLSTYLSRMEHRSSLRYENLHTGWPSAFVIGREGTFTFSLPSNAISIRKVFDH